MAGIVTASMPVWIVENEAFGNRAYCTLNEGLGKVLRYGAYGDEVLDAPALDGEDAGAGARGRALAAHGPHRPAQPDRPGAADGRRGAQPQPRRHLAADPRAGAAPRRAPATAQTRRAAVLRFIDGNDHFFLNLSMPACKCCARRRPPASRAARAWSPSWPATAPTSASASRRCRGRWFTAPAPMVDGLYLPGFTADDAAPDIGDSVITETAGIGGFAMAAAPAIVQFVGGTAAQALGYTRRMYEITARPSTRPTRSRRSTSAARRPASTSARWSRPASCPSSTPASPTRSPASAWSAPGWSKPPCACFRARAARVRESHSARRALRPDARSRTGGTTHEDHRSDHPARHRHPGLADLRAAPDEVLQAPRAQRRQRPAAHPLEPRRHPPRRRDPLLSRRARTSPSLRHGLPRPRRGHRRPVGRAAATTTSTPRRWSRSASRSSKATSSSSTPASTTTAGTSPRPTRSATWSSTPGPDREFAAVGEEEEAALDRRRLRQRRPPDEHHHPRLDAAPGHGRPTRTSARSTASRWPSSSTTASTSSCTSRCSTRASSTPSAWAATSTCC